MFDIIHLNKYYGRFCAVNDLNLHIDKGDVFGFVGHNGAGKTTTMRIVAGLLAESSGIVTIDGENIFADRRNITRKIGYMPDFFGVYDNLKTMEYLEFYASMYGMLGQEARDTCLGLLDLVNLTDKADNYVDHLSRGMKQRLCLARALVGDPALLLLDEPASGLDPSARFEMKEIMKNLGGMGKTIIISSHILPELADMCNTIGIMKHGHMVMQGTIEELERQAMHSLPLHIQVTDRIEDAVRIVKEDPFVSKVRLMENELLVEYAGGKENIPVILKKLVENDIPIESFFREKGNLETLFMEVTNGNLGQPMGQPMRPGMPPQGMPMGQPMRQGMPPQGMPMGQPMRQGMPPQGMPMGQPVRQGMPPQGMPMGQSMGPGIQNPYTDGRNGGV